MHFSKMHYQADALRDAGESGAGGAELRELREELAAARDAEEAALAHAAALAEQAQISEIISNTLAAFCKFLAGSFSVVSMPIFAI